MDDVTVIRIAEGPGPAVAVEHADVVRARNARAALEREPDNPMLQAAAGLHPDAARR